MVPCVGRMDHVWKPPPQGCGLKLLGHGIPALAVSLEAAPTGVRIEYLSDWRDDYISQYPSGASNGTDVPYTALRAYPASPTA